MDDLIIRVLGGIASPFEEERLKRWRGESPENEMAFRDLARVWALTAPEAPAAEAEPPNAREILERASGMEREEAPLREPGRVTDEAAPSGQMPGTGTGPRPFGSRRHLRLSPGWWLMAAAVAALSLGLPILRSQGRELLATHQAPTDQSLTVSLADGSFVRLAEGARLREWEGEGERVVSLEGRAFFAVTRDEGRPFEIRTSAGRVRVLGTRFELQAEDDFLRTVVVEGRVEVSNGEGAVLVTAGQVATARGGAGPSASNPEDVYRLLDWPEGVLVFQGTPLRLVAQEVTRFFGQPLVVSPGTLENRRITAWFRGESFQEVSEALCMASGALCRGDGPGVSMTLPEGEGRRP